MARNYNLGRKSGKKRPSGETVFIALVFTVTVVGVVFLFSRDMPKEVPVSETVPVETQAIVADTEVEISATPVSMVQAGTLLADRQNALIGENEKYLRTVRNAEAAGYRDAILMTDTYKQLLSDFHKEYMMSRPAGSTGVLWSEYGVWEFNAVFDYAMEENKSMKAVWMCYDASDTEKKRPYAICTATYVTESGQFIEPELRKTEWYPDNVSTVSEEMLRQAGAPEDIGVSADQCGDTDAENGSNDDGVMTEEQKRVREELQRQIDSNKTKENAVSITH